MRVIQVGDWVKRKSYGGDIVFIVRDITNKEQVILQGVAFRLLADAPLLDLILVTDQEAERRAQQSIVQETWRGLEQMRMNFPWIEKGDIHRQEHAYFELPGKVLHLDGDQRYLMKCMEIYRLAKIPVSGYHVLETDMASAAEALLPVVKPDIIVITGHDSLTKLGSEDPHDLSKYRHSASFVRAVEVARQYEKNVDHLIVVAGACQSHFEALLEAGANFASSPGRIMIHALDPLQVAIGVAVTSVRQLIDPEKVVEQTIGGRKGMGGIQCRGVYRLGTPDLSRLHAHDD